MGEGAQQGHQVPQSPMEGNAGPMCRGCWAVLLTPRGPLGPRGWECLHSQHISQDKAAPGHGCGDGQAFFFLCAQDFIMWVLVLSSMVRPTDQEATAPAKRPCSSEIPGGRSELIGLIRKCTAPR